MTQKDFQVEAESLIDFLEALQDPRIDRTKKHKLIAICAAICGSRKN